MTLTRQELESKLWQAADILRGQIDSADYKNYIFSILFLKRLSDHFDEEVENAIASGVAREVALTDRDEHEFFVPESARWSALTGASMNLGEALNVASHAIEDANTPSWTACWPPPTGTTSPSSAARPTGNASSEAFSTTSRAWTCATQTLREDSAGEGNVLGDAYEYLIYQFADDAGKKGGEFYTPRSVVRLVIELLQPREGMRICDPTAGSGGMLIYTAQFVREHGGEVRNLALHGQERNLGTLAIGKLNLLLHGLRSARLEAGDVIAEPGLVDMSGRLLSYDRVIANPPFSLKSWGHDFAPNDPHHRFDRYGAIPPRTRGDLAFLLHMLAVTNAQGMVGVVMPHGVLFPGRRRGEDTPRDRGGRPVRGGHRSGSQPLLRGQYPRCYLRAEQGQACRAARQGAVFGRGAGGLLPPGQGPELHGPRTYRQYRGGIPCLRGCGPFRPRRQP